ncbi:MAG TPA: ATP12 family protein, partial [Rhizomicrobium sp.]|nr:ATP12 family protein [Rhizomicrobium sp.]
LDGKPVRTPGGHPMLLPTSALAENIAEEWADQGEEIDPRSMPMTRLANTVQDGVAHTRNEVIGAVLRFGEHELLCYRAPEPPALAARQAEAWDPLLEWLTRRFGVRLEVAMGLGPLTPSPEALARLRTAIGAQDDYALAALHVIASITGSLVLALALVDDAITPGQAFQLSRIDEDFQAERWGEDVEAAARTRALAREMNVATAFLAAARD